LIICQRTVQEKRLEVSKKVSFKKDFKKAVVWSAIKGSDINCQAAGKRMLAKVRLQSLN
jgi:hypothetical protein